MAELIDKIKAFLNSPAGMIVSIAILLVLVVGIWGYIFFSPGNGSKPTNIPQVANTNTSLNQNTQQSGQSKSVPAEKPKKDETTGIRDLELFQLKDPFRPLVAEQAASSGGSDSEMSSTKVTTGSPVVP